MDRSPWCRQCRIRVPAIQSFLQYQHARRYGESDRDSGRVGSLKVFGIVGWKNSGKTGLMERLVSEISGRGYKVSTIKHAHHNFDVDREGKDSHRHRKAGAREVMLASSRRWALMHELSGPEPGLFDLLEKMEPVDLVLVEGFKSERHSKIETRRQVAPGRELALCDSSILAIASDFALSDTSRKIFHLDDTAAIADFILASTGFEDVAGRTSRFGMNDRCEALG